MTHLVSFRDNVLQELEWQNLLQGIAFIGVLAGITMPFVLATSDQEVGTWSITAISAAFLIIGLIAWALRCCSRLAFGLFYFMAEGHRETKLSRESGGTA